MAKNKPYGDNQRRAEVKERSQFYQHKMKRYVERNIEGGKFVNVKADRKRFKGVRRER